MKVSENQYDIGVIRIGHTVRNMNWTVFFDRGSLNANGLYILSSFWLLVPLLLLFFHL